MLQHRYNLKNIMLVRKSQAQGEMFCVPRIGKFIETDRSREVTCWGREE